ncbi:5-formyltetrahydrofolate cyclo-ligase [Azorhizobium sp. AG788]|uniref:5-formyltetrahydrofolate cyclo-ligase n=1 Tax=Azorhizobium sp. AG788 TaxID=2183897 RepID=UPI0010DB851F|nr:5-formyltetrahydrofolate cyclo-ligase [Azorhizobium sp. AG788]TDT96478.1 5-formyltetrahydrofolate cyclo-ligase [Azorhizobium sp. AG788]
MTLSSPTTFRSEKARLRAEALLRRADMGAGRRAAASDAAARHALMALGSVAGRTVALFAPFRDEIDTGPLARKLRDAGARLALPVVMGRDRPLIFRLWDENDLLEPAGAYGIPTPGAQAPQVTPDDLMVPLAVFDRTGARIGYGAGFYDRTLALLRRDKPIRAFGLAFACQETDHVPAEPHDEPLDGMVTEAGVLFLGGSDADSLSR